MITPIVKNEGRTVVFGPCRLSYAYLFNKFVPENGMGDAKYMTSILIPSGEKGTLNAIKKAIEAAKAFGLVSKWGGKEPRKLDLPLRDGDEKEDDVYAGMMYINAKSCNRPGIVDRNRNPIVDEEEIYSGVWAIVSVTFYPYNTSGNCGIACGLNNVMKFKDDEQFGGRISAENDFAGIDIEDDEDL